MGIKADIKLNTFTIWLLLTVFITVTVPAKADEDPDETDAMKAAFNQLKTSFKALSNDLNENFTEVKKEAEEIGKSTESVQEKISEIKESFPDLSRISIFPVTPKLKRPEKNWEKEKNRFLPCKIPLRYNAILKTREENIPDSKRLKQMLNRLILEKNRKRITSAKGN
ncbi:hypothetical protein ACFL35_02465 [Candidatus Riflebacteria bacterium]